MTAYGPATAGQEPLHILDLPQLYTWPSCESLTSALDLLALEPPTFRPAFDKSVGRTVAATAHEVADYLTRVVSSPLHWLSDEDAEAIRDIAARRLSERSGRTGMASFTRTFSIPLDPSLRGQETLDIHLHEPALTGDDLGHKTWSSSYAVSKLLQQIIPTLHPCVAAGSGHVHSNSDHTIVGDTGCTCITLELGAGTGLLGLSYAALTQQRVLLTDLPEILPNLARNLALNQASLPPLTSHSRVAHAQPRMACGALDWAEPRVIQLHIPAEQAQGSQHKDRDAELPKASLGAQLILVADPIYSPEHPRLLVSAVATHLAAPLTATPHSNAAGVPAMKDETRRDGDAAEQRVPARVLVAYPVSRAAYLPQIAELKALMGQHGLTIVQEGREEDVQDDWDESVVVEWNIWGWELDGAHEA